MTVAPFDMRKTPFPWFGGKSDAADVVWGMLGDTPNYVEPFFGGGAVLLRRPHPANRKDFSETVNDVDGLLVNFWRSVRLSPDATVEAASWPVSEADKTARTCAVLTASRSLDMERLMGDPDWHDPKLAGWWVWCVCVTIGAFGAGGPWWPDENGRLRKFRRDEPIPLGGVFREVPALGNEGRGVNHPAMRDPGVSLEVPVLSCNGQGVNHPAMRDPGVWGATDDDPFVMPRLIDWFRFLSARLRHVRIINGDWKRAMGNGVAFTVPVRTGKGPVGVFLDPPYAHGANVYRGGFHDRDVASECVEWAAVHGDDPRFRIVLAGFDGDGTGETLANDHGWTTHAWHKDGFMSAGYGSQSHRERLWASPHCLKAADERGALW